MATLHLMVGLPCSGKTTLARKLETQYAALRLSLDEWHIRLFGHDFWDGMTEADVATHNSRHELVESLIWDVAARVLLERLEARNDVSAPGTFFIPGSKLKQWMQIFEPPSAEELESL